MPKFINTQYENTVDSLIKGDLKKFNNPYYTFTDKKPTKVNYLSINRQHSTLDESSKLWQSLTGPDSPIKYNKIIGAFLYGLDKITTQYENGEWGLEAASIEGEGYVLPNTFEPTPGDYFSIDYVKETLLFKVTDVTKDTLDTGANFYKIQYKLDQTDFDIIEKDHIVETYRMIVNNVGTQFKAIVRDTTYDLIKELEITTSTLKMYMNSIFFSDKVQTFIFNFGGQHFYDPYMIEFIKRNKILENDEFYVFVDHACYEERTFPIDYDRTFFRALELKDVNKFISDTDFVGMQIMDINSLMQTQYDPYYKVIHNPLRGINLTRYEILNPNLIYKLSVYERFPEDDDKAYYNIIIDYFDDKEISGKDIEFINKIDYLDNKNLFYVIPMLIYIIENNIKTMLS